MFGIIIVVILAVFGILWWFVFRDRDKGASKYQRGDDRYGVDNSVTIRRTNELPRRGGRSGPDLFEVVSDIGGLQRRVTKLEEQIAALREVVRELKYSGTRGYSSSTPDLKARVDNHVELKIENYPSGKGTHESTNFSEQAKDAYLRLSSEGLRNLPIEPLFVYLDVDSSALGAAIGESHRLFKQSENKQNAFVIFQQDGREGWLFPNPKISYTEAMRYVFPELSYENFTDYKQKVDPARVRLTAEGIWEMMSK